MKSRDYDRENSELLIPFKDFLKSYNKTIPVGFPKATGALLKEFRAANISLFKHGEMWSLDQQRKKVMDWLPQRTARL